MGCSGRLRVLPLVEGRVLRCPEGVLALVVEPGIRRAVSPFGSGRVQGPWGA